MSKLYVPSWIKAIQAAGRILVNSSFSLPSPFPVRKQLTGLLHSVLEEIIVTQKNLQTINSRKKKKKKALVCCCRTWSHEVNKFEILWFYKHPHSLSFPVLGKQWWSEITILYTHFQSLLEWVLSFRRVSGVWKLFNSLLAESRTFAYLTSLPEHSTLRKHILATSYNHKALWAMWNTLTSFSNSRLRNLETFMTGQPSGVGVGVEGRLNTHCCTVVQLLSTDCPEERKE